MTVISTSNGDPNEPIKYTNIDIISTSNAHPSVPTTCIYMDKWYVRLLDINKTSNGHYVAFVPHYVSLWLLLIEEPKCYDINTYYEHWERALLLSSSGIV